MKDYETGETALHIVSISGMSPDQKRYVIDELSKRGIKFGVKNEDGLTAKQLADTEFIDDQVTVASINRSKLARHVQTVRSRTKKRKHAAATAEALKYSKKKGPGRKGKDGDLPADIYPLVVSFLGS